MSRKQHLVQFSIFTGIAWSLILVLHLTAFHRASIAGLIEVGAIYTIYTVLFILLPRGNNPRKLSLRQTMETGQTWRVLDERTRAISQKAAFKTLAVVLLVMLPAIALIELLILKEWPIGISIVWVTAIATWLFFIRRTQ